MLFRKSKKTDADLLARYQRKNDMQALGELYERYMEMVYGTCLKYLKNPEKAEDAVMGIFEQVSQKAKKHNIKDFRPWLYVFTKNYCLMQLRKKEITQNFEPHLMQSDESLHPLFENPSEDKEIQLGHLEDCIETLPAQQKQCIDLFYLQEQSYKVIAEGLDLPLGKVRSYIQNGRRNLKNCMETKMEKERHEADG